MEYNNAIMKFKEQNKEDNSTDSSNKVSDYLSKLNTKWSERPAPYKASTWENVGVAATPMLLGLLLGDVGTGAEHAAKGLQAQQKSEMDVAKKLYARQTKLDVADSKARTTSSLGAKKGYITKQGKVVWKNPTGRGFIDADSNVIPSEKVKVYTPADIDTFKAKQEATIRTSKDPLTSEPVMGTIGNMNKIEFNNNNYPKGWNNLQEGYTKKSAETYSKFITNTNNDLARLKKISSALNEKNVYSQTLAIGAIIKEIETRPTDEDVKRYTNPLSIKAKSLAALRAKFGNRYPKKLLSAMKKLMKDQINIISSNEKSLRSGMTSQARGQKIDSNYFLSRLGNFRPSKVETRTKVINGKEYLYERGEDGLWHLKK